MRLTFHSAFMCYSNNFKDCFKADFVSLSHSKYKTCTKGLRFYGFENLIKYFSLPSYFSENGSQGYASMNVTL